MGIDTADSRADPVGDTDVLTKIFDEVYEQYKKGYTTKKIDQLSAQLTLAIMEQESADLFDTTVSIADTAGTADQSAILTAEPTADMTAEHSVTFTVNSDIDLAQLQYHVGYVVVITTVRSDSIPPHIQTFYI